MDQVKIIFEHEGGTEGLWATRVENGFRIDNYPLYVKGVCFQDIVQAEEVGNDIFRYVGMVEKSENSLYRIFYVNDQDSNAKIRLKKMMDVGCTFEGIELDQAHLLAINIPAEADANLVWNMMKSGLDDGVWEVQEGDDRHPESE